MTTNYLSSRSVNLVQSLINYADSSVQVSASATADYTTFGQNWTQTSAPSSAWYAIATSANGQYITACIYGGLIYTSNNYGQAWTANGSSANWSCIALSGSGQMQVAAVLGGGLYYSTNFGATWTVSATAGTTAQQWSSIAIAAAGANVYACAAGGNVWYSTDNGQTWTGVVGLLPIQWNAIACSASAVYVTVCVNGGPIYYSNNYGISFTQSTSSGSTALAWISVALSASGKTQCACVSGGSIWYSNNYGVTWTSSGTANNTWKSVSISASGLYGLITTNSTGASTNTLLYNYRFNVGDVSGTMMLDFANGQYDAFLMNGAIINTSQLKVGTGSLFLTASAAQYASIPAFQMTSGIQTSGLTIMCWVKPVTTTGTIFQMSQSNLPNGYIWSAGPGYAITLSLNGGSIYYYLSTLTNTSFTTTASYSYAANISTSVFTHIALVLVNGVAPLLYVNGIAIAAASFPGSPANTLLPLSSYFGGMYPYLYVGGLVNVSAGSYPGYYNGYMDEFRFYTSAIPASQISTAVGSTNTGLLAYTTNSGQSWAPTTGIHANYQAVTMSSNGQFLVACVNGGGIFTSLVSSSAVATSSNLTVSGNTTTALLTYNDNTVGITGTPSFDLSTFGLNWTAISGLSSNAVWYGCAISATGQYQVANIASSAGTLWYSLNYGQTWALASITANQNYNQVAMSSSGQYQVLGIGSANGLLYTSTNYGATWSSIPGVTGVWGEACVSASGQYMTASQTGASGTIYYSSNSGSSWVQATCVTGNYMGICCSISGQYQSAILNPGVIYTSNNYGVSWAPSSIASANWNAICCSASGQYQTAAINNGMVYYSNNYGQSWSLSTAPSNAYTSVVCSSSGQYQVLGTLSGGTSQGIYYSSTFGQSWTLATSAYQVQRVTMSADAHYCMAVVNGGAVYTSITRNPTIITSGSVLVPAGNVGIGTSTPGYNLDVNGTARISNILTVAGSNQIVVGSGSLPLSGSSTQSCIFTGNTLSAYNLCVESTYGVQGFWGVDSSKYAMFGTLNNWPVVLRQNNTEYMRVHTNGYVGIGTTNPASKLTVQTASISTIAGLSGFGGIHIQPNDKDTSPDQYTGISWTGTNSGTYGTHAGIMVQGSGSYGSKMYFLTTNSWAEGSKTRMILDHAGNLGIGTLSPAYTLDVNGTARITGAINISGSSVIEFGFGNTKEGNAGKIGYGTFDTAHLCIVGAGTTNLNRNVKIFDNAYITNTLNVTGATTLSSTLNVTGATTLSSTLNVNGITTLNAGTGSNGTFDPTTNILGYTASDGSNIVNLQCQASIYGRNMLYMTGRYEGANDGWSFTTPRNGICFRTQSSLNSAYTNRYTIQNFVSQLGIMSAGKGSTPITFWSDNGDLTQVFDMYIGGVVTLTKTGDNMLRFENTASVCVKNSAGTYEPFLWPRFSDNATYLNYGSAGFYIRNNAGTPTMFMTNGRFVGIGNTSPIFDLTVGTGSGTIMTRVLRLQDGYYANGEYGFEIRGADNGVNGHDLQFWSRVGGGGFNELMRIKNSGNVGIGNNTPLCKLDVVGAANIWTGTRYAVVNNNMSLGSLTIGSCSQAYGGGSSWSSNTAGLMMETNGTTEIAVHHSGTRVASLLFYNTNNYISIGRDAGWGVSNTAVEGLLLANNAIQVGQQKKIFWDNVGTDSTNGISWGGNSVGDYSITRSAGAWNAPDYQQLQFRWITGFVFTCGGQNYGKSFVDFQCQTRHTNGDSSISVYGPNSTWSSYLVVGASGSRVNNNTAQVITTNGNLHLDSANSRSIYLNNYAASTTTESYGTFNHRSNMNVDGSLYATSMTGGETYTNGWFRINGAGGIYWQSYGRGIAGQPGNYGNITTYGTGGGSWNGYNINSRFNLMANNNSWGLYDSGIGNWHMIMDQNNTTVRFVGNVGIGDAVASSYRLQVHGTTFTNDIVRTPHFGSAFFYIGYTGDSLSYNIADTSIYPSDIGQIINGYGWAVGSIYCIAEVKIKITLQYWNGPYTGPMIFVVYNYFTQSFVTYPTSQNGWSISRNGSNNGFTVNASWNGSMWNNCSVYAHCVYT